MAISQTPARSVVTTWTFEPGHTAAEFKARHMMVSWVRGHIKNIRGTLTFDPDRPAEARTEAEMDVADLWTGVKERDDHLKSADFFDAARFPKIHFKSTSVERVGADLYRVHGDLTIRDVTRPVTLEVRYLGQWETPWSEGGVNLGPRTRAGFEATARIDRKDFGVSWNASLDRGGLVVSDAIDLTIDVEAIKESQVSSG